MQVGSSTTIKIMTKRGHGSTFDPKDSGKSFIYGITPVSTNSSGHVHNYMSQILSDLAHNASVVMKS
eukprot:15361959-Ditylum_brightwellii.AAC.1